MKTHCDNIYFSDKYIIFTINETGAIFSSWKNALVYLKLKYSRTIWRRKQNGWSKHRM